MSDAFLTKLEDELLGLNSQPSFRQRLELPRFPLRSIPNILRGVSPRDIVEALTRTSVARRSLCEEGRAMPPCGMTMTGRKRLRNIRLCIEQVLRNGTPGDFLEAGVWRGGAAIYMRAVLKSHGFEDRTVWLADSFQGVPPPDSSYGADKGDILHCWSNLAVSREQVESHFRAYGLLDDRVRFLPGWFKDSLKSFPRITLALLRIDCDLYASTITVLTELYDRVAEGGIVIVDRPCHC